jgi:hypothetical protein
MDAKGYVKLVDLGLAKQIPTGSTWYAPLVTASAARGNEY